ncbi:MAG: hypothetical protein ACRC7N_17080 [Clostridium sp.]
MDKNEAIQNLTHILSTKGNKFKSFSKESLDSNFIEYSPLDSFSSSGPIVYGEEQDVDDL